MARLKVKSFLADNPYDKIKRGEEHRFEGSDCSVQAVAIVCGVTYAEAHAACKALGRKDGKGMSTHLIERAVEALGCKVECRRRRDFIAQYPGAHKNLQNVTTHHPSRFNKVWADGKTYLFYTTGHVAAVVDGANGDWCRRNALRVTRIVEVTKLTVYKGE